jgi:hypothetical protein
MEQDPHVGKKKRRFNAVIEIDISEDGEDAEAKAEAARRAFFSSSKRPKLTLSPPPRRPCMKNYKIQYMVGWVSPVQPPVDGPRALVLGLTVPGPDGQAVPSLTKLHVTPIGTKFWSCVLAEEGILDGVILSSPPFLVPCYRADERARFFNIHRYVDEYDDFLRWNNYTWDARYVLQAVYFLLSTVHTVADLARITTLHLTPLESWVRKCYETMRRAGFTRDGVDIEEEEEEEDDMQ